MRTAVGVACRAGLGHQQKGWDFSVNRSFGVHGGAVVPRGRLGRPGQGSRDPVCFFVVVSLFKVLVVGVGLSVSEGLSVGVLQVASSAEVVGLSLVQSVQVLLSTALQLDGSITVLVR